MPLVAWPSLFSSVAQAQVDLSTYAMPTVFSTSRHSPAGNLLTRPERRRVRVPQREIVSTAHVSHTSFTRVHRTAEGEQSRVCTFLLVTQRWGHRLGTASDELRQTFSMASHDTAQIAVGGVAIWV